jgi:hypothetical protein
MKTKRVELYADLYPGWQDSDDTWVSAGTHPSVDVLSGRRRIRIVVDLPCFGGSAEASETVYAKAEVAE